MGRTNNTKLAKGRRPRESWQVGGAARSQKAAASPDSLGMASAAGAPPPVAAEAAPGAAPEQGGGIKATQPGKFGDSLLPCTEAKSTENTSPVT